MRAAPLWTRCAAAALATVAGALLLAGASTAGTATAAGVPATGDARLAGAERIVADEMQQQHIPGLAVAIVQHGKVVMERGFGLANVELQVPVTPATMFQSGSVGKQFTAALVMTLVEEGRVGLDDSVRRYFTDAPESWQGITVRQLLTHTSGLPDFPYEDKSFDMRHDHTEDELVHVAYGLKPEAAPGAHWDYSNAGYMLLGALVRRVTGRFYGDVLAERIFEPLGMHTARIISEADIVPNRAAGYHLVDGQLRNQDWVAPTLNTTADGSLYLSLEDMLAWARGLAAGAVLKPASWEQVYSPVQLAGGGQYPYGFGWFVDGSGAHRCIHHSGSWQGFKTYIARYDNDELQVIALTNQGDAEPGRVVDRIATLYGRGCKDAAAGGG